MDVYVWLWPSDTCSASDDADSCDAELETSEDESLPDVNESDEEGDTQRTTVRPTLSLAGGFRWDTEGGGGGASGRSKEKSAAVDSSSSSEEEMETEVRNLIQ